MSTQRILVPLDGSEFSQQVIPAIEKLFRPEDVNIILFEAIEPPSIPSDAIAVGGRTLANISKVRIENPSMETIRNGNDYYHRAEALRHQHKQALKNVVHTFTNAGFQTTVEVEMGEPASAIAERCQRDDIDMIAMATHGRSGISHLLMGSIAEEVLRTISLPILLIRPS